MIKKIIIIILKINMADAIATCKNFYFFTDILKQFEANGTISILKLSTEPGTNVRRLVGNIECNG